LCLFFLIFSVLFLLFFFFFFFNATAPTEISPLSLHDALPICDAPLLLLRHITDHVAVEIAGSHGIHPDLTWAELASKATRQTVEDRKSTRLNSSHDQISYAVFCLKKKKKKTKKKKKQQKKTKK